MSPPAVPLSSPFVKAGLSSFYQPATCAKSSCNQA
eukprot:CAMPEP_0180167194 /NCGR_PEP_ID=MMETSP0986-20121125/31995_1 /TAXON_ID=697907 /ORGANISM="non described non described, Strain CCMP2293" /LENGTH=34 /DNA_ID= /DNA_START= /DNA_END= /DNA_ORIENTATION=